MMQVQNQTQQISEEEFLLPLSEDELASIAGGDPPPRPFPKPGEFYILSNAELDAIERRAAASPRRPNPLDQERRKFTGPVRRGSFLGFFFP